VSTQPEVPAHLGVPNVVAALVREVVMESGELAIPLCPRIQNLARIGSWGVGQRWQVPIDYSVLN